jgi:hypothetical protein
MLVIFGRRRKELPVGQLALACPKCKRTVFHNAVALKSRFTLFFVPLIPMGTRYLVKCGICGYRTTPPDPLRRQLAAWRQSGKAPPGIQRNPPLMENLTSNASAAAGYCKNCGKPRAAAARFCTACGQVAAGAGA